MTTRDETSPVLAAVVAYEGARFHGWQRQEGQRTVQGCLEEALQKVAGAPVPVRGAGRTDAGVHARGQRASWPWPYALPPERLLLALAHLLPEDVSVTALQLQPPGFDAKRDSLGKRYCYRLHTAATRPVFERRTVWHRRCALDLEAMRTAAAVLVGEHDYESFRKVGGQDRHARRTLWRVEVSAAGPRITLEVRGNAFVRGMVRAIAGTLYEVGRGQRLPEDMARILAARDRAAAGVSAPACGLTLEEVYYPGDEARAEIPDWASWPGFRWPSEGDSGGLTAP